MFPRLPAASGQARGAHVCSFLRTPPARPRAWFWAFPSPFCRRSSQEPAGLGRPLRAEGRAPVARRPPPLRPGTWATLGSAASPGESGGGRTLRACPCPARLRRPRSLPLASQPVAAPGVAAVAAVAARGSPSLSLPPRSPPLTWRRLACEDRGRPASSRRPRCSGSWRSRLPAALLRRGPSPAAALPRLLLCPTPAPQPPAISSHRPYSRWLTRLSWPMPIALRTVSLFCSKAGGGARVCCGLRAAGSVLRA